MSSPSSSIDLDTFRGRCRSFLAAHPVETVIGPDPRRDRELVIARRFQQARAAAGLAGIDYPVDYGGQGLGREHEQVWREEYGAGPDVLAPLKISHGMCLPVLNEFGTDAQKVRYLARSIRADDVWCQMFSEPGAGSDVASLQTRAVREGDGWRLSGQKVWTTLAHASDYGIVLARTDSSVPKHAGISMFIVDMRAPGIEIRAIRQMDFGAGFNEVFLTDVAVSADALVSFEGDGWRLATAMLAYERVAIGAGPAGGITQPVTASLRAAATQDALADPVLRQELMRLYIEETLKSLVAARGRAAVEVGRTPGPAGSLGKLQRARIARITRDVAPRLLGMPIIGSDGDDVARGWAVQVLTSFQESIAGGTDEIQRNILAERILGLPREAAVDKGVPFSAVRPSGSTT